MRTLAFRELLVLTAGLTLSAGALAQETQPIPRGQVMANSCVTCHGAQGRGPGTMPSLRAYTQQGLINKLLAFKGGEGDATIMHRHARGYTEAEIREMAAYLGQLGEGGSDE
jgi:sulfide dehydrogenase cytochrome subunit